MRRPVPLIPVTAILSGILGAIGGMNYGTEADSALITGGIIGVFMGCVSAVLYRKTLLAFGKHRTATIIGIGLISGSIFGGFSGIMLHIILHALGGTSPELYPFLIWAGGICGIVLGSILGGIYSVRASTK